MVVSVPAARALALSARSHVAARGALAPSCSRLAPLRAVRTFAGVADTVKEKIASGSVVIFSKTYCPCAGTASFAPLSGGRCVARTHAHAAAPHQVLREREVAHDEPEREADRHRAGRSRCVAARARVVAPGPGCRLRSMQRRLRRGAERQRANHGSRCVVARHGGIAA
jgi:hypothetical protein